MQETMRELQTLLRTDLGSYITMAVAGLLFIIVSGRLFKKANFTTKSMAYAGLSLALAFILSTIRIYEMPNGGSITPLSMFFVTFIGFLFGPAIGIIGGITFGLLRLAARASVIHPVQLLLDYPLAFGMLGLSGFFWKRKYGLIIGFIVGSLGRFVMAWASGYFFWMQRAPGAMWGSAVYNSTYILPDMAITLVILAIPQVRRALMEVKRQSHEGQGQRLN